MINPEERLPNELLTPFMRTFFGYGDLQAPFWLVGKEEGLGVAGPGIRAHLDAWDSVGRPSVADLAELQEIKGEGRWFGEHAVNHPMWRKLARITLAAKQGRGATAAEVLSYQASRLGRCGDETALLELMPLPALRASDEEEGWPYPQFTDLPELQSRAKYRSFCIETRTGQLRSWIRDHRPRWVVFYSTDAWYLARWDEICGMTLEYRRVGGHPVRIARKGSTVFMAIANPAAPGVSNSFLDSVGVEIRRAGRQQTGS